MDKLSDRIETGSKAINRTLAVEAVNQYLHSHLILLTNKQLQLL